MEQIPLTAQKRTVLGRKVKKLRAEGLIPAHVFGNKIKTEHIQVKATDFSKVYEKVGETGIVELTIDGSPDGASAKSGEKKPVLVRKVQFHPVTDEKIEVDITKLANVGDEIKVKDLAVDRSKIEIHTESELVVIKIGEFVTKEMEAVEAEIEAEKVEVAAPAEAAPAAEGAEAAPEGAKEGVSAEEKPTEVKPEEKLQEEPKKK